ncbi:MAG: hydrolase [Phycisphaerae bacterium]
MPTVNTLESELAVLVVVDVQEKLLPLIGTSPTERIVDKIRRLIGAARVLDVPILHTEQYPRGLGPTVPPVREALPPDAEPIVKTMCSCWRDEAFREALRQTGREHVILAGIETHICIQQTVLDLIRVDYIPFIAADAVGSRFLEDRTHGLDRMRHAGAEITTTESLLFELIKRCDHPRFKEILNLVK